MAINKMRNALIVIFTLIAVPQNVYANVENYSHITFSGRILPSSCSVELKNNYDLHLNCPNGLNKLTVTDTGVIGRSNQINSSTLNWIDGNHAISIFEYN